MFLLTETWHTAHEDVALRRCVPIDYSYIDVPRPTTTVDGTNHGGVAAIISSALGFKYLPAPVNATTFESVAFTVGSQNATVAVLLVNRPGSKNVTDLFFTVFLMWSETVSVINLQTAYRCHP